MKTIYYAFVQKLEVPDSASECVIDDMVFKHIIVQAKEPTDYIWSETPDLFDFESY